MIPYASRTGTATTLAALREAGWRLMVSASGVLRTEGMPYALDNGAWSAHTNNRPFDAVAFVNALRLLGKAADFVVVPDIVNGGEASLELSFRWMRRVLDSTSVALLAVQDGHEPWQVAQLLKPRLGVFVGGSTAWKLATLPTWAAVARERNAWCHVGRVNTARRVALCGAAGATSFDGSGVVRFPSTLARVDRASRRADAQGALELATGHVEFPW